MPDQLASLRFTPERERERERKREQDLRKSEEEEKEPRRIMKTREGELSLIILLFS